MTVLPFLWDILVVAGIIVLLFIGVYLILMIISGIKDTLIDLEWIHPKYDDDEEEDDE